MSYLFALHVIHSVIVIKFEINGLLIIPLNLNAGAKGYYEVYGKNGLLAYMQQVYKTNHFEWLCNFDPL